MQKITVIGSLYHSALIANLWEKIMYDFGYKDYCASTTSFQWISYAYTKDAPPSCIERGEALWKTLVNSLGDEGNNGGKITIGKANMSTVSRRRDLWDK